MLHEAMKMGFAKHPQTSCQKMSIPAKGQSLIKPNKSALCRRL